MLISTNTAKVRAAQRSRRRKKVATATVGTCRLTNYLRVLTPDTLEALPLGARREPPLGIRSDLRLRTVGALGPRLPGLTGTVTSEIAITVRSLPRASAFHRFPLPLTAVRQLQHFSKKTPWTSTGKGDFLEVRH